MSWVKSRHLIVDTAITLGPGDTVGEALGLLSKRAHGAVIVVEDERPVGVVTEADCLSVDRFTQLREVMSREVLTLPDTVDPQKAFDTLHARSHRLAPVVDAGGRLVGYAGPPNRKSAEAVTKYIVVDMYAKAIQGMAPEEAVKWAHDELVKIYGA